MELGLGLETKEKNASKSLWQVNSNDKHSLTDMVDCGLFYTLWFTLHTVVRKKASQNTRHFKNTGIWVYSSHRLNEIGQMTKRPHDIFLLLSVSLPCYA